MFNETIQKLEINEKTLNDYINKIRDTITELSSKVRYPKICQKLMENYLYFNFK